MKEKKQPSSVETTTGEEEKIEKRKKSCILTNALFPVCALFIFVFVYYLNFNTVERIKDLVSAQYLEMFNNYGVYGGILLSFLSLILSYILLGLKKLFRLSKFSLINPIILALSFAPWYFLSLNLALELRYTDIARLLLDILVDPIHNASLFMLFISAVWFGIIIIVILIKKFRPSKNIAQLTVLLFAVLFFTTGCLSQLEQIACDILPDSDHCFQAAAMQSGNPDDCEDIKGTKFVGVGSNPPKDKCYLYIAENTGNLDSCKKIKGGAMSYTPEECYLSVAEKFEDPSACKMLTGENNEKCRTVLSDKIEPADVIAVDDQIDELKKYLAGGSDAELEKQLKGLEAKRADLLDVLTKNNKVEYEKQSDPINQDILGDYAIGDLTREAKDKLIALNESLKAKGVKMTQSEIDTFKNYYKFISDPANDIEQMDDNQITKDRWNEKLGNVVDKLRIWRSNPSAAESKLDEQLRFYERMLERQQSIDAGLSEFGEDVKRHVDMVNNAIEDKIKDEVKDKVIETVFGEITGKTVGASTAVIGEALDVVKGEAKSKEFRGLVRAYNLGMEEELAKSGGDVEKAHAAVVKNLQNNPYEYEDTNTFAKYGNILENKDCDGTNPHCVNKDVFWKAMKKSFKYQNDK
jgi:hypothetical protein